MNWKIEGQFVQHIVVTLEPGEDFYAQRGSLIYIEDGIKREISFNGAGMRRILGAKVSGESVFIIRLLNTSNTPRKAVIGIRIGILPIELKGESMICQRGAYIGSENKVQIATKFSVKALKGGMGFVLQKIQGNSTVFLSTNGVPITLNLKAGESITADEDHIIALHGISRNQLKAVWSARNILSGVGLSVMKIDGPGTVYLSPGRMK